MSFDVTPPTNKPAIRETASMQNNGGAGNLGYFESERKKQKEQQELNESIFHEEQEDTFQHEGDTTDEKDNFSFANIIAKIIFFFKNLIKK